MYRLVGTVFAVLYVHGEQARAQCRGLQDLPYQPRGT